MECTSFEYRDVPSPTPAFIEDEDRSPLDLGPSTFEDFGVPGTSIDAKDFNTQVQQLDDGAFQADGISEAASRAHFIVSPWLDSSNN